MQCEVYSLDQLEKEVVKMHRKNKDASLKQWGEMIKNNWKSFNKRQSATEEFSLNDAVQIFILYCSQNLE